MTDNRPYPLLPAQRDAAWVIAEFHAAFGRSPTFAELARELDIKGKGRIAELANALVERGWLEPYANGAHNALKLRPVALEMLALRPLFESGVELTDLGRRELAVPRECAPDGASCEGTPEGVTGVS